MDNSYKRPHNSSINKLLAIEYYNENNVTQAEVSKIFKISRQTFSVWLKDCNQNSS
jgi:DNA-binding XRE family transcriptional regulator